MSGYRTKIGGGKSQPPFNYEINTLGSYNQTVFTGVPALTKNNQQKELK